ncbi:MAG: DUF1761 domain-containing protein [bacterium]
MNMFAILVAALAAFIIGFLFHGPVLGKVWMKLANITPTGKEKFSDMIGQMIWNYLANVLTAGVLAGIIYTAFSSVLMGDAHWYKGAIIAAWMWLGFIFTSSSIDVIWMGKSWKLWLFEAVASLVCFAAMGAILAAWR